MSEYNLLRTLLKRFPIIELSTLIAKESEGGEQNV